MSSFIFKRDMVTSFGVFHAGDKVPVQKIPESVGESWLNEGLIERVRGVERGPSAPPPGSGKKVPNPQNEGQTDPAPVIPAPSEPVIPGEETKPKPRMVKSK